MGMSLSKWAYNNSKDLFRQCQNTAQKLKFSIKDFFSKLGQIRWELQIWSHLLKKALMENLFLVQ